MKVEATIGNVFSLSVSQVVISYLILIEGGDVLSP